MIDAYLDESGVHQGASVCSIAGYFGGPGQWKNFAEKWVNLLNKHDVPLDKFHAKELFQKSEFFRKWDAAKHKRFLSGISQTILKYRLRPVSVGLVVADFLACSLPQRRFLTGARMKVDKLVSTGNPNKPYFMPFTRCIKNVLRYAEGGGKANFFFGLNHTFSGYAKTIFQDLLEHETTEFRDRIGTDSYPLAKETPQMQAADFFSYLVYKDLEQRVTTCRWNVEPEPLLKSLIGAARTRMDFQYFDKTLIDETLKMTYELSGNWDGH